MKQTRAMSLVEAATNVLVGYAVAVAACIVVFPLFGISVSMGDNLAIAAVFSVISIVRSFLLRRVFEAIRVAT